MARVLRVLDRRGPCRTDAIASILGLPLPAIQKALTHLKAHGAVVTLDRRAAQGQRRYALYALPGDDRRERDNQGNGALLDAVWHGRTA